MNENKSVITLNFQHSCLKVLRLKEDRLNKTTARFSLFEPSILSHATPTLDNKKRMLFCYAIIITQTKYFSKAQSNVTQVSVVILMSPYILKTKTIK